MISRRRLQFQRAKAICLESALRATLQSVLIHITVSTDTSGGTVRIWTVDAQDASSIDDDLFYKTTWIESFLSPDSTKFLLVASKGFGKTLLLRAKRERFEKHRRGIRLLPENELVDKPLGIVPVFSKDDIARLNNDPAFWEGAWLIAITLAVLKTVQRDDDSVEAITAEMLTPDLGIVLASRLNTITDIFAHVVALSNKQYFKAQQDLQRVLGPAFRDIHTPVAAFIDNVDEHFNAHVQSERSSSTGATDKAIWYLAQTGLASAIRKLHGQNQHVKIFAAVRSEAFARLLHHNQMSQQLEGSTVRIEYLPEELREIFVRNLAAEPDANCVSFRATEPFERFFGAGNLFIVHSRVGEPEHIWDYVRRHTLGRPRDLMTIGAALSNLPPKLRSAEGIRRAVNDASENIAAAYLNEIGVHLTATLQFERLWALIERNTLTHDDLRAIASRYNRKKFQAKLTARRGNFAHVFCSLYKAGLLGYVARDVGTGELAQKFERPGDLLFSADGLLPDSDYYIIHPALDSHIRTRSHAYVNGMDTLNIAGDGRLWRPHSHESGVIKADVVNSSRIMMDPGMSRTFTRDLEATVRETCRKLSKAVVEGGDTIVLVDRNAANLVQAIREIARRLFDGPYGARLRAGADFGRADDGGLAYRTSARLEAVSEPDRVCATREFKDAVERLGVHIEFGDASELATVRKCERRGTAYNISKGPNDPELLKELVVFRLTHEARVR